MEGGADSRRLSQRLDIDSYCLGCAVPHTVQSLTVWHRRPAYGPDRLTAFRRLAGFEPLVMRRAWDCS